MAKQSTKMQVNRAKNATKTDGAQKIVQGKVSVKSNTEVRNSTSIIRTLLSDLQGAINKYDAMDILVDRTPFGKMALNVYTTLINPDGEYIFKNPKTGKRTKRVDAEWKQFCKQRFMNSDAGIEAVFEILTRSLLTRGDMAYEIIVAKDLSTIQAIAIIDPKTFDTFEWIDSENRYALYQRRNDGKKVDLYSGNFMRFPYQPNIDNPFGTLLFEPAIVATTNYYQHSLDKTTILYRVGTPRFKMTLDEEAILESASYEEKKDFDSRNELFANTFANAEAMFKNLGRDSDILTFKSNDVDIVGGNSNSTSIDLRAWTEVDMVEICNSYSLPKIYLNAESGGSYALGTAEERVLINRVDNSRDNMVKIKESIGDMFCRVKGYNAVCEFVPKPIEWEKMVEKWEAELKKLEWYRRAEEYDYISTESIVNELTGEEKIPDNQIKHLTYSDRRRGGYSEVAETDTTTETEESVVEENINSESEESANAEK